MRIKIFTILLLVSYPLVIGCSRGEKINVPIIPESSIENPGQGSDDLMPLLSFNDEAVIGMMGRYNLTISPDGSNAELAPIRTATIGNSFIVSGKSFFDTFPCRDCFRISGLGYEPGQIIIKFSLRHPFPKGDTQQPPSGKNRLDLDLFDIALVVVPQNGTPIHYALLNQDLYYGVITDPDGYTTELGNLFDNPGAMPYVLIVDDSETNPPLSTFNRFEMGAEKEFDVRFPISSGESLDFDLFLTFGYGASATLKNRLNPVYYNPEFNRKAAWKVEVIPPNGTAPPILGNTWDDGDSCIKYDVTVKVWDWQIGADVDPNLANPTDIRENSDVAFVGVVIPGMNSSPPYVLGKEFTQGGTGMPDNPLVYKIPVANENLLAAGEYIGLVDVHDKRDPLDFAQGRDYLVHSPDGVTLNQYQMADYLTYQTFIATVVVREFHDGNLIWAKQAGGMDVDIGDGITTLSDNSTVVTGDFRGTATFGPGEPNKQSSPPLEAWICSLHVTIPMELFHGQNVREEQVMMTKDLE